ncbi:MAG: GAF domain-containing protein [Bacteroidales bacterium]
MENFEIPKGSKADIYKALIPQINALVEGESDLYANLANIAAALKEAFNHFWVGFYLVKQDKLVLGPFQGPVACTRIAYGRGVCGAAWKEKRTLVMPDVDKFPGHIACSSLSKSEIVVPLFYNEQVVAVLDIDSMELNSFDQTDAHYLEQLFKSLKFSPSAFK